MISLDQQTPEQHRARYFELMARARARAGSVSQPPPPVRTEDVVRRETIPGGWYTSMLLARGQILRLIDPPGGHGVSMVLWHAHDTSERLNVGDTVKLQWTAAIGTGHVLMSDMGRVLAAIVSATPSVRCDLIVGGSTRASTTRKYGSALLRNSADNFVLIAGKHGLGVRDVPPCMTVFAAVHTDHQGRFVWGEATPPGSVIDLRAELDVIVGLSNCPHPLAPDTSFAPGPIECVVWRGPPASADDPYRTAGEEAARAYENTAAWLDQHEALR